MKRYGTSLKTARELPDFVLDIKPPNGVVLAADYQYNGPPSPPELEGDLHALGLIDLERTGLGEYRAQLDRFLAEQIQQQPAQQQQHIYANNSSPSNTPGIISNSNQSYKHYHTGAPPAQHRRLSSPTLQGSLMVS